MEKSTETNDLCRDTTISLSDADSIPEQLSQLISLMQLSQAPGTKKIQNYSWRSWLDWLTKQKSKHEELSTTDPYHPGKYVLGLYLLQMRVVYNYSHSTVVNCFWNQLCSLLKDERGVDLKEEMGEFMRKLFRAMVRKYGHTKFKVCPLLNGDLMKWERVLKTKDNREPQIKLRALIMYGRHLGWRGDTISYMKLKDVVFKSIESDGQ